MKNIRLIKRMDSYDCVVTNMDYLLNMEDNKENMEASVEDSVPM